MIEDIVYADSFTHELLALNDGNYITIENGMETLFGEAFRIKDGNLEKICRDGEAVVLKN